MKNIEAELLKLGVTQNYVCYWDIYHCTVLALEDMTRLTNIQKELYIPAGAQRGVQFRCVENAIRRMILDCWNNGNQGKLESIMKRKLLAPPSNAPFLSAFVFYIKQGYPSSKQ